MAFTFSEVSWAAKPYREIRELGARDGSIAVVPFGSLEQHGHHMPVATDSILVNAVAQEGAQRVADDLPVVVTPPVWTGSSPHHLPFGGTVSAEVSVLLDLLSNVADTALENGFDALLILNGHGGNVSLVGDATTVIGTDHPEAQILGLTYFQLATAFIDELRESELGGMAHAGEFETAMMLHLHPELVHEEAMEIMYMDEPYDLGVQDLMAAGPLSVYRGFDEYSESGTIGDPSLATAEKGERIFELLGDEFEELLRTIHDHNRSG